MRRMLHFVIEGTRVRVLFRNSIQGHHGAALGRINIVFKIKKLLSAAIAFPALLAAAGLVARPLLAKLKLRGKFFGAKGFKPFDLLFLLSPGLQFNCTAARGDSGEKCNCVTGVCV